MAQILSLPNIHSPSAYQDRLKTNGQEWTGKEKKLVDLAEFFEAMIIVLDDVKLHHIQDRDYAMVEIITEEISRYQHRLEAIQHELAQLRSEFNSTQIVAVLE